MREVSDPNLLCQIEVNLIDNYNTMDRDVGYNMMKGGLGGRLPREVCERIAEKRRGVPLSEEHRKNISKALMGHPSYTTPESAKKISATMKERGHKPPNHMKGKFGEKHHFFGKFHTDDAKRKISEHRKANPVPFSVEELRIRSKRWMGEGNPNYVHIDTDGLKMDIKNGLGPTEIGNKYGVSRQAIHYKFKNIWGVSSIAKVKEILDGKKTCQHTKD